MKWTLFILALLTGTAARAADNIVVVFDASGSMGDKIKLKNGSVISKMDAAKAALKKSLLVLPKETNLGVLVFSASNLTADQEWVYPIGPIDQAKLSDAIDRPTPSGGTPLGEYMKKGADALLDWRAKQKGYGTFTLIEVTDGAANDQGYVERYLPLVQARGVRVQVIGLAMEPDGFLAKRANFYTTADDIDTLASALKQATAEVPTGKDGKVDPAWFEEIEPLPNDTAKAILASLVNNRAQDQPIGEEPKMVVVMSADGQLATEPNSVVAQADTGRGTVVRWVLAIAAVVAVVAVIVVFEATTIDMRLKPKG